MEQNKSNYIKGIMLTILGAIAWGFSGTCGQYLMNIKNINPQYVVTLRLLFSGLILISITLFKNKKKSFRIFKNKRDTLRLFIFAIFGMTSCQYSFLVAIHYTNAPTTTVIQFLSSIFIVIGMCIIEKRLPRKVEIFAIIFAVIGTFALTTHFSLDRLVITPLGLFWGLVAAFAVVIYTLTPIKILQKYSSIVVNGFGMFLGGILLTILVRPWTYSYSFDIMTFLSLAAIILIGTVFAFTAFLHGVSIIGPVKGSLIAGLEAISALVFSIILLGETFSPIDLLGMAMILFAVSILSFDK